MSCRAKHARTFQDLGSNAYLCWLKRFKAPPSFKQTLEQLPTFTILKSLTMELGGLVQRVEALKAELRSTARKLKRLRGQAAYAQQRSCLSGFTPHQSKVAVAIYLEARDEDPAVMYLSKCLRSRQAEANRLSDALTRAEMADLVFTWVLQADSPGVASPLDEDDESSVWKTARAWASEWKTVGWVRAANAKGVAPSSIALAEAFAAGSLDAAARLTKRSQLRWAQRFRSRWCLARRLPPTKPPLPDDMLQEKVGPSVRKRHGT